MCGRIALHVRTLDATLSAEIGVSPHESHACCVNNKGYSSLSFVPGEPLSSLVDAVLRGIERSFLLSLAA